MKTKTILFTLAAMCVFSFQAFAGPSNCGDRRCPGGGCRPCPPPPCRPCHPCRPCPPPPPCRPYPGCYGYRGSSGVRMAADIVSLVGASLDILRGPAVVAQPMAVPAVYPVSTPVIYR